MLFGVKDPRTPISIANPLNSLSLIPLQTITVLRK